MLSLNNLKNIAYLNVDGEVETLDDLERFLKIWWSNKYNLPPNHNLLMDLTLEEILIQYYSDLFIKDEKALESFKEKLGKSKKQLDIEWLKANGGALEDIEKYGQKI